MSRRPVVRLYRAVAVVTYFSLVHLAPVSDRATVVDRGDSRRSWYDA